MTPNRMFFLEPPAAPDLQKLETAVYAYVAGRGVQREVIAEFFAASGVSDDEVRRVQNVVSVLDEIVNGPPFKVDPGFMATNFDGEESQYFFIPPDALTAIENELENFAKAVVENQGIDANDRKRVQNLIERLTAA